jgi:Zn finger protein HypA/HybF involved in hydrogenase expression
MASRDRYPFFQERTTNVRCPRCGARMAEVWATERNVLVQRGPLMSGEPGSWDGMVYAERLTRTVAEGAESLYEVDNPPWRCQRCKTCHEVDNRALHDLLRWAERNNRRDVTLGG